MYSDSNVKFKHLDHIHVTLCKRRVHDKVYMGKARCHPADYDFESKLVGEHYAYMRSLLAEMRAHRNDLLAELRALNHVYDILLQNNNVSKQSIECYTLRRQIKLKERDLAEVRALIKDTNINLRETIQEKDKLYVKLREKRNTNNE